MNKYCEAFKITDNRTFWSSDYPTCALPLTIVDRVLYFSLYFMASL